VDEELQVLDSDKSTNEKVEMETEEDVAQVKTVEEV